MWHVMLQKYDVLDSENYSFYNLKLSPELRIYIKLYYP